MKGYSRQIIATEDGSHTISIPDLGLTYHSNRGAIAESTHVFIEAGLKATFRAFPEGIINVLEMGFGTGLNAFLTSIEAAKYNLSIHFTAIEQYPISDTETAALNYPDKLGHEAIFTALHTSEWGKTIKITPNFSIHKIKSNLADAVLNGPFYVIYFDAFAPDAQPELWTEAIFSKLYKTLAEGGILTTYCSKSIVRKAMTSAGFTVKKIPGPHGKREMVQAFKYSTVEGK